LLAKRVKQSFEYFHPDIECRILTSDDEEELFGDILIPKVAGHVGCLSVRFLSYLKKQFDTVIKLDADVVITGKLDEFLADDYDVACSLNVEGINPNFKDYCNLGVTAVRSKDFADEWCRLSYDPDFISNSGFSYFEQDIMNMLAQSGKYKTKIVDKEKVYYNETARESWDKMVVKSGGLWIGDRQVKALHWAGGGELRDKFDHPSFSREVRSFLNKVTNTNDFKPRVNG
jgi:hypothetical protein